MSTTLLGVRHHGPGSARAVRAALEQLQPDRVLVEGPVEGTPLLRHVPDLVPPVALLVHDVARPRVAGLWPFAVFSPEWQAVAWAHAAGVRAELADLPAAQSLARRDDAEEGSGADVPEEGGAGLPRGRVARGLRADPLGWLARAAGHDDPERWWEDVVEHRSGGDPLGLFAAVAEAMAATRAEAPGAGVEPDPDEAVREAALRTAVRSARRDGAERVAVVCGAWHVPALAADVPAAADAAALRGLRRVQVRATWVPWTSARLAADSGYGAGVASPGWYEHLFGAPDRVVARWMARVCALLREADLPGSPAAGVEAVRLAEALAALRGRSLPGLAEVQDAALAALCGGDPAPLEVVRERLVVGTRLGSVPDGVPTVPLQHDLEAQARRLRLRRTAEAVDLDLDLRTPTGLGRSRLLHRLTLLDVPWGRPREVGSTGTFKEGWRLRWDPALAVAVLDAAPRGTTVEQAAVERARERRRDSTSVEAVTGLLDTVVLAGLPQAVPDLLVALDTRAAKTSDVTHLLSALPPLARVLRYGDVRGSDTPAVRGVWDALLARSCAGLPAAAVRLDDDGAATLVDALEAASDSVALLATQDQTAAWRRAQRGVADAEGAAALPAGRCARLLLDVGEESPADASRRLARALSGAGASPAAAGAWLEGFLRGSGLLLVRDDVLFDLVDEWLAALPPEDFDVVLPLVRRAFGVLEPVERRQVGARARHGSTAQPGPPDAGWDAERVARVLPVLAAALGAAPGGPGVAASGSPEVAASGEHRGETS